jgi:hypothetical protein
MRMIAALAASGLLMGCNALGSGAGGSAADATEPAAMSVAGFASEYAHLRRSDCYTVELYDEVPVEEPEPAVPARYTQFLGWWENGAWNGDWCHDLLIYDVDPSGRVELLDMHAPSEEFGLAPSVFKRTARIHEDGTLRFAYGTETRRYRIEGGVLVGHRSGSYGRMQVALVNPDFMPLPVPRPVRASKR